ncbi:hypothetical protein LTR35_017646 [Friedmanniomyces endolithicus]|uniref:Uncharacterized protein n=1 Tax=Friedmanniomyces endolithicus TaxID=329885 RepID=A0AAN6J057_9PEZI|nr:hypothetical protein LTR35_017646 [Friedmanniomyces endolithicus]KAK0268865.1 hypothetical protein LTS00_017457 [Friedmanniomyces endolithicus]KAK0303420.1 hypothetical protein LTR82_017562 [Friedmanniomyces endolithicus]KAK0972113.1 hypothetical protein LTR54_017644 [Friedmanniomyces endolithicus]
MEQNEIPISSSISKRVICLNWPNDHTFTIFWRAEILVCKLLLRTYYGPTASKTLGFASIDALTNRVNNLPSAIQGCAARVIDLLLDIKAAMHSFDMIKKICTNRAASGGKPLPDEMSNEILKYWQLDTRVPIVPTREVVVKDATKASAKYQDAAKVGYVFQNPQPARTLRYCFVCFRHKARPQWRRRVRQWIWRKPEFNRNTARPTTCSCRPARCLADQER